MERFLVISGKLEDLHRSRYPPAFGPPNHLQKLVSCLGVSLRSSSEHRAKQGLQRRHLKGFVAFANRDRSSCFVQRHRAQTVCNSAAQCTKPGLRGLFLRSPVRVS
jgi:hypothetical protein